MAGLLVLVMAVAFASRLYWGQAIEAADADYATGAEADGAYPVGTRTGEAGRHALRWRDGGPYAVVTPANYRLGHAHSLLVVYAPTGFGAGLSERHAGLTQSATARSEAS